MHNFGYSEEGQSGSIGDIRLWQRVLHYCQHHSLALVGAVALSLIVTLASLGLPRLMQMGIDHYIVNSTLEAAQRIAGLGQVALWYGLLVVVIFLVTFLQVVVLEWIGQSIMQRLRRISLPTSSPWIWVISTVSPPAALLPASPMTSTTCTRCLPR